jgi:hypothetical protein
MTLTKKQVEAWKRLRKILAKVPRERFDMNRWVGADWKGAKNLSCGTSACAAGWATTDPWFRRRGLRLLYSGTLARDTDLYDIFGPKQAVFWNTVGGPRQPETFVKWIDRMLQREGVEKKRGLRR